MIKETYWNLKAGNTLNKYPVKYNNEKILSLKTYGKILSNKMLIFLISAVPERTRGKLVKGILS